MWNKGFKRKYLAFGISFLIMLGGMSEQVTQAEQAEEAVRYASEEIVVISESSAEAESIIHAPEFYFRGRRDFCSL